MNSPRKCLLTLVLSLAIGTDRIRLAAATNRIVDLVTLLRYRQLYTYPPTCLLLGDTTWGRKFLALGNAQPTATRKNPPRVLTSVTLKPLNVLRKSCAAVWRYPYRWVRPSMAAMNRFPCKAMAALKQARSLWSLLDVPLSKL